MTDPDAQLPERDHSSRPATGTGRWSRSVRLWSAATLAAVTLTVLISVFVAQPFQIPSGSMADTLRPGDRVIVNKLAYRFGGEVRRGDVIVFDGTGSFVQEENEEESGTGTLTGLLHTVGSVLGLVSSAGNAYVKRVIGVGGDRVRCCDSQGRIEVNGEPLDESYVYAGDRASDVSFDIEVPAGRLWVMGDHRSDSADSREYLGSPGGGTVPVDEVIGRVEWITWPPGRWGSVRSGHG